VVGETMAADNRLSRPSGRTAARRVYGKRGQDKKAPVQITRKWHRCNSSMPGESSNSVMMIRNCISAIKIALMQKWIAEMKNGTDVKTDAEMELMSHNNSSLPHFVSN